MNNFNIIGLSGPKGSGKSVVADYLINNGYIEYAFAEPLKKAIQNIFMLEDEQLWGSKKELIDEFWKVSPRSLMQTIGTDIFRERLGILCHGFGNSENIWVRCFEKWLQNLNNNNNNIVVSDIRFVNEAEKIKELGGKIYYISRNNKINDYSQHSSESSMELRLNDYIDYKINNNGTIQELYNYFHFAISSKASIRNI